MYKSFLPGDPVPQFKCRSSNNERGFHFNTVAGRYVVLCFFGSAAIERSAKILAAIHGLLRSYFDDDNISFFGVSADPSDETNERIRQLVPGIRYFWDFDYAVSKLYGAMAADETPRPDGGIRYNPFTLILDPMQRVLAAISFTTAEEHVTALQKQLSELLPKDLHSGVPVSAPVLVLPRVFDHALCRELIRIYEERGGAQSGFMREIEGKTTAVLDDQFKRRTDCNIEDHKICEEIRYRIVNRLVPEIQKVFQFKVTRMERYLVACYDGRTQGFFHPHRDNTTKGTAHRRFAVTINLNAEEYEGGNLRFPEFGNQTYRAPTGGAVVFSCSLLHEALPVTKGRRYAFLPFLYDDEAAAIRQQNLGYLSGEVINLNEYQA